MSRTIFGIFNNNDSVESALKPIINVKAIKRNFDYEFILFKWNSKKLDNIEKGLC